MSRQSPQVPVPRVARALCAALPIVCLLAFVLPLVASAQSPAQSGDSAAEAEPRVEQEEEITVTARLLEEALEDVPATVSVLTIGQIEAVGVERAEDFIKLIPGVSMVDAAEVGDTQVNIRGINGSRDAENSFAFVLDGVLMTNPAAFNREFSNLRQIEVLKGPQGALYGRNAAAGAIIVTTRTPTDEHQGEVQLTAAEDASYVGFLALGGPLGDGSDHRYQLTANWRTSDGYYDNDFLGRAAVDDYEAFDLGGRILLHPNPATTWDIKAQYGEVEAGAITFNSVFALPDFASVLGVPEFFQNVNEHEFAFLGNIDPLNEQEAASLSVKLDRDFDWGRLTAWVLWSDIENSLSADGTSGAFGFFNTEPTCIQSTSALFASGLQLPPPQILGPTPGFSIFGAYTPTTCDGTQFQARSQEDVSFELRLSGAASDRLRWQVGTYYLDLEREVGVNLGIDLGQGVARELFVPAGGSNPTEQLVHDRFDTQVASVFGSLRYDLSDDVELSLAVRYDREERDVTNLVPADARTQYVDFSLDGQFTGGAPLNPGLDPLLNPGGIQPQSATFEETQPKISLTWDASESLTFFGSWGVGFKSGGFNNQGSRATIDLFYNALLGTDLVIEDAFDEETSSAFELGFKSRPSRDVYVEGAVFQTEVDDMQFFEFLVGPFGLLRVVSNIDEVEIQGAELSFSWAVSNSVTIRGGYAVTDSEILANSSRPATIGNESPYTPDSTANLALEYSRPVSDSWIFSASAFATHVGDTWFHTVQNQERVTLFNAVFPGLGVADYSRTRRDSFTTVDLRIGVLSERYSITLFGTNLGDEDYLEEVIPAPEFGGSFIHPGSQRRVGVEFAVRF